MLGIQCSSYIYSYIISWIEIQLFRLERPLKTCIHFIFPALKVARNRWRSPWSNAQNFKIKTNFCAQSFATFLQTIHVFPCPRAGTPTATKWRHQTNRTSIMMMTRPVRYVIQIHWSVACSTIMGIFSTNEPTRSAIIYSTTLYALPRNRWGRRVYISYQISMLLDYKN